MRDQRKDPNTWPPPGVKRGAMDLQGWMAIASWSLSEDVATKVCEKAFEDYARAYESAIRDGLPEAAARAWALTALGDPYEANHLYRNSRLSDRNAILAEQASGPAFAIVIAVFTVVCGLFVFGGVWNWFDPKSDHGLFAMVLVTTVVLYVAAMVVAFQQRQQAKRYWADLQAAAKSSLDTWINEATRLLCANARQRVSREVTSHYEAARAEMLHNGATEDQAEAHALETLGDPKLAWRRFYRAYFTTAEVDMIRKFYLRPWSLKARYLAASIALLLSTLPIYLLLQLLATPAKADWGDVKLIGILAVILAFSSPFVLGLRYPRTVLAMQIVLLPIMQICIALSFLFDPDLTSATFEYEHFGAVGNVLKYPFAAMLIFTALTGPWAMFKTYSTYIRKLKDPHNRREVGL